MRILDRARAREHMVRKTLLGKWFRRRLALERLFAGSFPGASVPVGGVLLENKAARPLTMHRGQVQVTDQVNKWRPGSRRGGLTGEEANKLMPPEVLPQRPRRFVHLRTQLPSLARA